MGQEKLVIPLTDASIDIGNDGVKGYIDNLANKYYITNVISRMASTRQIDEKENDPEDALHVEITSGALSIGKACYGVGPLAMRMDQKDELDNTSIKAENDQSIVMLLTTLALDAAKKATEKEQHIEIRYNLSTGIPLKESKKGLREVFKKKIKENTHQVRFLTTPGLEGITVVISFEEVLVNSEGRSGMFDLILDDNGRTRNDELRNLKLLLVDIGGLSTDAAVILPGGKVDNESSDGLPEGVSKYLDQIIDLVLDKYPNTIKSRRELVDIITDENPATRNRVGFKGVKQPIQEIVDERFGLMGNEQYKFIHKLWTKANPDKAYIFGGGAVIGKEYIDKENTRRANYPLNYLTKEESIWMIARSYFKILKLHLSKIKEQDKKSVQQA